MTSTNDLKALSDDELLSCLADLVRRSRCVEATLIAHVAEVDERRLYLRDAPSMFAYCTQVLHLSEHEAYARITVARAARRLPVLLDMLRDGRLHASGIGKLVPHLTDENVDELLLRATQKSKRQIEELVAAIAPQSDVPVAVRKVPVRDAIRMWSELGPDRVPVLGEPPLVSTGPAVGSSNVPCPRALPPPATPAAAVTPLAPARYKVQFSAGADFRDKLERLQNLMRADVTTAIEAAVTEKLARLEAKRFGLTGAPRKHLDETDTAPCSRYLPAAVRRHVRARDGDQCTFTLRSGHRCAERRNLEFHHREPYARGGTHDPENVHLMCRQHNAHVAELDYGKERMSRYRRQSDRVSERASEYAAYEGTGFVVAGSGASAIALRGASERQPVRDGFCRDSVA